MNRVDRAYIAALKMARRFVDAREKEAWSKFKDIPLAKKSSKKRKD